MGVGGSPARLLASPLFAWHRGASLRLRGQGRMTVTNKRASMDVLYQLSWGDFHAGVVVRGDTVVDAPPILKTRIGKSIGPLLYWIAHQPHGGWVRLPKQPEHRAYQRQQNVPEPAPEPPPERGPLPASPPLSTAGASAALS